MRWLLLCALVASVQGGAVDLTMDSYEGSIAGKNAFVRARDRAGSRPRMRAAAAGLFRSI
jgi:hypothetical protein